MSLQCDPEYEDRARLAVRGHPNFNRGRQAWSYPPDPLVVRNLIELFPTLEISVGVQDFLDQMMKKQQRIFAATTNEAPLDIDNKLWPFQRSSIRFLEEAGKAILAHEMGTGKTVIASSAVKYLELDKVLVICPNPIKWSWADHFTEWADKKTTILEARSFNKKTDVTDRAEVIASGHKGERDMLLSEIIRARDTFVLIINYDQLRIHQKVLQAGEYDVIIVDEAHRIGNRRSQQTQAALKVCRKAKYAWLLTGTPIRNHYMDIWTLLHVCDPDRFSSFWHMLDLYMLQLRNPFGGTEVLGLRDEKTFNAMLSAYMYRKTKEEVMPDLPDKIYTEYKLPLNPKQQVAYQQMERDFILSITKLLEDGTTMEDLLVASNTISQLIRLRQLCLMPAIVGGPADSAKLDFLEELLSDLYDQQFIIFTCFRKFIPFIEHILTRHKISYDRVVGGQSSIDRDNVIKGLNSGHTQAIIGTIQAMGEGLNLQAASTAIFTDRFWVPAVNIQAEDRIHRGEIKSSPNIIYLHHPHTVEDDILTACKKKSRIADETSGQVEVIRNMLLRGGYHGT